MVVSSQRPPSISAACPLRLSAGASHLPSAEHSGGGRIVQDAFGTFTSVVKMGNRAVENAEFSLLRHAARLNGLPAALGIGRRGNRFDVADFAAPWSCRTLATVWVGLRFTNLAICRLLFARSALYLGDQVAVLSEPDDGDGRRHSARTHKDQHCYHSLDMDN